MSGAVWFDPVLHFANAKDLRQALLGEESLKWQVGPWRFADEGGAELVREWLLHPPPEECWDWRHIEDVAEDQARLRKMLAALEKRGKATPQLWEKLSQFAGGPLEGDIGFSPRSQGYFFIVHVNPQSIAHWYSFALAELIARGHGGSVRRCELDTCGDFFVAAKSRGPKRRYCSISHGSQARTKKFRENKR